MITRAIREFCPNTTLSNNKQTICGHFTVFPFSKCYPIAYPAWKQIFQEIYKNEILSKIEQSKSFFFHVWNGMRKFDKDESRLEIDSAYEDFTKKFCPRVYEDIDELLIR